MSHNQEQSSGTAGAPTDKQPDYDAIEELIEVAQTERTELADHFGDKHEDAIDGIRRALEDTEDIVDEAQDADDPSLLNEASAYIDDAQTTRRHLEDAVDFEIDTEETVARMNRLDNAIEDVEDALENAGQEGLVVRVSGETFIPDEFVMEPSEILETAGFDRADYLLYHGPDAKEDEDPAIEKGTDVDLREHNIFSAIPDETGYGGHATDTPEDSGPDLATGIAAEVEDLRDDYDVDVDTEAEDQFIHVIVRDYDIPADTYDRDEADVMIRVPEGYPEQAPDWVYVEEGFELASGGLPRKAQTTDTNPRNSAVLSDWVALSWHIRELDRVEWKPYQHDLRWYLETIVHGRLAQGD